MKFSPINIAMRTALVYLLFGGLWILLSDHLLAAFSPDPATLTQFQTYKGWLFVLLSAALIYFLLKQGLVRQGHIEAESHENLERYRLLFETSLDAILLTVPDGRILAANPAACKIFGRTEAELCQAGRSGIVDVTDPRLIPALEERARTGSFSGELTFVRSDGSKFPGEISTKLFSGRDGQARTSMIIRDISERKRAEQALRESEERYRLLIERSPYAIGVHQDGKIVFANPTAAFLFGASSADDLIGMPILNLIHPEARQAARDRISRMLKGETGLYPTEDRYLRLDGKEVPVEVTATPFTHNGRPAIQVIALDITGRKHAEAALAHSHSQLRSITARLAQLEEAERRVLAKELHDRVGQSLTALNINLGLIRSRVGHESPDKLFPRFDSALGLVTEITDHIRNVMAELHPPVLDDYGLVAAIRWYADRLKQQTGLQVEVSGGVIEPQLPISTSMVLFRIVQEALTNVIKHAKASLTTIHVEEMPGMIQVTIADNGRGFEPSQPAQDNAVHWGLATMRERAESVNGHLHIESAPGNGTKVTVSVPR